MDLQRIMLSEVSQTGAVQCTLRVEFLKVKLVKIESKMVVTRGQEVRGQDAWKLTAHKCR